jgi:hypothetical protein
MFAENEITIEERFDLYDMIIAFENPKILES